MVTGFELMNTINPAVLSLKERSATSEGPAAPPIDEWISDQMLAFKRYHSVADKTYHMRNERWGENALVSQYSFIHPPDATWPPHSIRLRQPANTTPLLSIPLEIRLKIFSYLLISESNVEIMHPPREIAYGNGLLQLTKQNLANETEKYTVRHGDLLRLLQINRQLYTELMPFFYQRNTFECSEYRYLRSFLSGIGLQRRKCIRSVVISHAYPCGNKYAGPAYRLLGDSCCLSKLHIKVFDRCTKGSSEAPYIIFGDFSGLPWEWSFVDLSITLPGLPGLKRLRGLDDVVIQSIYDGNPTNPWLMSTGSPIEGKDNQIFVKDLIKVIKSPKDLVEGEDARDIAGKKRTLKELAQSRREARLSTNKTE